MDKNAAENIKVAVRCRPMNNREIQLQAKSCFKVEDGAAILVNPENPEECHK